jgi:hypothetical protein
MKEIKLLAIAEEDGWAYFSRGDGIYLLRPPYAEEHLVEVSKDTVDKAVLHHGFKGRENSAGNSFDNLSDLIDYVKKLYVKDKKIPTVKELREVLKFAPYDVLDRFIARAENELTSRRNFGPVCQIVIDLLRLEKIKNHADRFDRVWNILSECITEWEEFQRVKEFVTDDDLDTFFERVDERIDCGEFQQASKITITLLGLARAKGDQERHAKTADILKRFTLNGYEKTWKSMIDELSRAKAEKDLKAYQSELKILKEFIQFVQSYEHPKDY